MASPYAKLLKTLDVEGGKPVKFYDVAALDKVKYARLPFSIRVLLESAVRNCDNFQVCACRHILFVMTFELTL
jgi:aconitate hydratase